MYHAFALLLSLPGAFAPVCLAQDEVPPIEGAELVLRLDARSPELRAFRKEGADWRYPETAIGTDAIPASDPMRTVSFGESVRYAMQGLDAGAEVHLWLAFLSDSDERAQQIVVDGTVLAERIALPNGAVLRSTHLVPAAALEDGKLEVEVRRLSGPNAVVAALEVWSSLPATLEPVPDPPIEPVDMPRPRLTPRPVEIEETAALGMGLGGPWRFHPSPPEGFASLDEREARDWVTIRVPGQWSTQGFEVPVDQQVGYRATFRVPASWRGHRLKLRCDSVYGRAVLWINGREAAVSERTFTPFEVDVTDFVVPGEPNVFAWGITNGCLADSLTYGTGYARHPLGGILRRLTLFPVPEVHASRFHVETPLDEEYDDATLRILLSITNEGSDASGRLGAIVWLSVSSDDQRIPLEGNRFLWPGLAAGESRDLVLEIPVDSPAKWHPEHPNLYDVTVLLHAKDGPFETLEKRIGFRQVEVRGTQLFVNGRRTKLRGVNRHEAHPLHGRSLVEPLWREDARLFREANVNFIRTSHYPPDERFLDAGDELGLFVEVESPITWVGHGASTHWKEWDYRDERYLPYLTRCALETIERDRSHPSVILWSLGNESLWSHNWARVAATARLADPTRPMIFHDQAYGGFNNQGSNLPVANIHYPGPNGPERIAEGFDRPVLFGEYCHLNVYNRQELVYDPGLRDTWGEALYPMWEKMFASDVCIGGAIWSGISDRFFIGDREVGYGSWGPIDGWRRTKPEYRHVFKTYSPIRVLTKEIPVPTPGEPIVLEVENRMEWTDLSELLLEVKIDGFWPVEIDGERRRMVEASGAPGCTGTVSIHSSKPPKAGTPLQIAFREQRGRLIDSFDLTIGPKPPIAPPLPPPPAEAPALRELDDRLEVAAGDVTWSFDRDTGQARCEVGGEPVVVGGPYLFADPLEKKYTLWIEDHVPGPLEPPNVYSGWSLAELAAETGERSVTVRVRGAYEQAEGRFDMEIDGAGDLRLSWEFTHGGEPIDLRELGIVFLAPRELDMLTWQGEDLWGATHGSAPAFVWYEPGARRPRESPPTWPWHEDQLPTGTNAFRGTKRRIHRTSLGRWARMLEIRSDGTRNTRCWISGDVIRLLVAELTSPGSENFLGAHWAGSRQVLRTGDRIAGTFRVRPR